MEELKAVKQFCALFLCRIPLARDSFLPFFSKKLLKNKQKFSRNCFSKQYILKISLDEEIYEYQRSSKTGRGFHIYSF